MPFDVRVNDCPVLQDMNGSVANTRVPINIWLRPGENTLSARMLRTPNRKGECSLQVLVTEIQEPNGDGPIMADLRLDAPPLRLMELDEDFEDEQHPVQMLHKHVVFNATVPFDRWRWDLTGSVEIDQQDRDEIITLALSFWQALRDRDVARVSALLRLKSAEVGRARYQTAAERQAELDGQLAYVFNPASWRLADFDDSDLEFLQYADGRLVYLVDSITGESPIHFVDRDEEVATYMDLFVYRDTERRWRIIR